jgi:tripartite motif-containing protein 37
MLCINVYVYAQGPSEPSPYQYRIELLNRRMKKPPVVREYTSTFEVGESWGYNRFARLEDIEKDGFHDSAEDMLLIRYSHSY